MKRYLGVPPRSRLRLQPQSVRGASRTHTVRAVTRRIRCRWGDARVLRCCVCPDSSPAWMMELVALRKFCSGEDGLSLKMGKEVRLMLGAGHGGGSGRAREGAPRRGFSVPSSTTVGAAPEFFTSPASPPKHQRRHHGEPEIWRVVTA